MRKLCLLAAIAAFAVQVTTAGGDRTQAVEPGIDTMPPVLTSQSLPCGVRSFTATETRNIPDPPRQTPNERDQVERGIQSIRLALDPRAENVRLQNLNPAAFPNNPNTKVTSATFDIVLIDPSKPGSCVVEVRDWNNNLTTRQVNISAATPTISAAAVNVGLVNVGQQGTGQVTITNNTDGPMTLTGIALTTRTRFEITAGGGAPVNLAIGGTHVIAFTYTPVIGSEAGDSDVLTVTTACGNVTCALSGTGGVSRLATTNDLTFDETRADVEDCTPTPTTEVTVSNTGNADLSLTGATFSRTEFYWSGVAPTFPIAITGGASRTFNVCFRSASLGRVDGTLTFTSNATDGTDNTVNLSGNISVSVEDEMGKTARVWFDAANEQIVFTTIAANTPVTIHDISGRVLANATATEQGNFRVNTSSWTNGVVVITYSDENGQRTRTLSIVR